MLAFQPGSTESIPDGWFYYGLSISAICAIGFLVWFAVQRYLARSEVRDDKVDSTLESIGRTLGELKTSNALSEEKIRQNEKRLDQHDKLFEGLVKKLKL